jgi:hypothetical protein
VTLKDRADLHDREIAAIRKLILTGMKMINRNQEQISELRAIQKVSAQELRELRTSVKAFIDGMSRGGNGHSKRPLR